jgi:hypothetical protein
LEVFFVANIEVCAGIPVLALFVVIIQHAAIEVERTFKTFAGLKTLHHIFELAQYLVTHVLLLAVYVLIIQVLDNLVNQNVCCEQLATVGLLICFC